MGKSSSQTVGYRYYLGIQAWLCSGVIDAVKEIRFRQSQGFLDTAEGGTSISVDQKSLFGGDQSEGGVAGTIDVEDGNSSQTANSYLSDTLYSGLVPAFRGISQLVFRAFYWGNSRYLGAWDVVVQRIFKSGFSGATQWYEEKAAIPGDVIPAEIEFDASFATINPVAGESPGLPYALPDNTADDVHLTWGEFGGANPTVILRDDQQLISITSGTLDVQPNLDDFYVAFGGTTFSEASAGFPVDLDRVFSAGTTGRTIDFTFQWAQAPDPTLFFAGMRWRVVDRDDPLGTIILNDARANNGTDGTDWTDISVTGVEIPDDVDVIIIYFSGGEESFVRDVRVTASATGAGLNVKDMNPAHIVREALTDTVWGARVATAEIDDTNFQAVADTLYDEGFGLSLRHFPSSGVDELISTVSRHVDMVHFTHRSTGLHTLKLIRDDYDEGTIPSFTQAEVIEAEVKREVPSDIPNGVVLKYWDWTRHGMASLSDTNHAKVQQDGGLDMREVDRPGIRSQELAGRVLAKELRSVTVPKLNGSLTLTRAAYELHPGDAFKVTDSRFDLAGEVLRVLDVDEGDGRTNAIRVKFVQDAFSLGDTALIAPEERVEDAVGSDPLAATVRLVQEAPYWELVQRVGDTTASDILEDDNDAGFVHVGAAAPNGAHVYANAWVDEGTGYERGGRFDFAFGPTLTAALTADPTDTTATISSDVGLDLIDTPYLAQIGEEIIRVDTISGTTLTVGRGCLDTIPEAHDVGDAVIFFDTYAEVLSTEYSASESVDVKVQTVTGRGELDIDDATADTITFDSRAFRPYPAANLQLEGSYAPTSLDDGDQLTWAHRDRLDTATVYDYADGNVGPEAGVEYRIDFFSVDQDENVAGTAYYSQEQTGTSLALSSANYSGQAPSTAREVKIEVTAFREVSPEYDSRVSPSFILPLTDYILAEDGEVLCDEDDRSLLTE